MGYETQRTTNTKADRRNRITEGEMTITAEQLAEYTATVARPGKFEGESPATVYFYEKTMEGHGDDFYIGNDIVTAFTPTTEEREAFDLTERYFVIFEDHNGFAYGFEADQDRLDDLLLEDEEDDEN